MNILEDGREADAQPIYMKKNNSRMKESIIFGTKGSFAIELGFSKNPKKFYLQFWLQNLQMGNFKKSDTLEMSIAAYKKILLQKTF